jgi:predicted phosphodiesterase
MRIAILSDIHGNRTAFEAVLADLRQTSPDLILHGGDLADSGSSPVEIVDRIRDLGWYGVVGNTDEMLFRPESLTEVASQAPRLQALLRRDRGDGGGHTGSPGRREARLVARSATHPASGSDGAHARQSRQSLAGADAGSERCRTGVGLLPLGKPIAIYGHIHRSYIRSVAGMIVANTGSVGLSYDGDCRAAYLLLDGSKPAIRRVEYDLDSELRNLSECGLPHAEWIAKSLKSASPEMP